MNFCGTVDKDNLPWRMAVARMGVTTIPAESSELASGEKEALSHQRTMEMENNVYFFSLFSTHVKHLFVFFEDTFSCFLVMTVQCLRLRREQHSLEQQLLLSKQQLQHAEAMPWRSSSCQHSYILQYLPKREFPSNDGLGVYAFSPDTTVTQVIPSVRLSMLIEGAAYFGSSLSLIHCTVSIFRV